VNEAGAIGSSKYKNLTLKKKRRRRGEQVYRRVYVVPYESRVAYGPSVTLMPTAHS